MARQPSKPFFGKSNDRQAESNAVVPAVGSEPKVDPAEAPDSPAPQVQASNADKNHDPVKQSSELQQHPKFAKFKKQEGKI